MHTAENRCSRGWTADLDGDTHGFQADPRVRVLQHGDDGRERGRVPDLAERIEGVPHHEPALVTEPRQQRGDRRHSHPREHFTHPYPDPPVWLVREERREHLDGLDRKSTRLNSSHSQISYAVFCLKKKKTTHIHITTSLDTDLTSPTHCS